MLSPYSGKLMSRAGFVHNRRGRPIVRWEDALVEHAGHDWQTKARQENWSQTFDSFRKSYYKSLKMGIPELARPRRKKKTHTNVAVEPAQRGADALPFHGYALMNFRLGLMVDQWAAL